MIRVFIGPMFSGKSNGLIEEYNKIWNKEKIMCFKPKKDNRDFGLIKTINSNSIKASLINSLEDIPKLIKKDTKTIFIDKAQFIIGDPKILLNLSLKKDIDINIAGLALSAEQNPFGIMPNLICMANEIRMYKAICIECNKEADYTYYDGKKDNEILVGNENYMPLCNRCLNNKIKKQKK